MGAVSFWGLGWREEKGAKGELYVGDGGGGGRNVGDTRTFISTEQQHQEELLLSLATQQGTADAEIKRLLC